MLWTQQGTTQAQPIIEDLAQLPIDLNGPLLDYKRNSNPVVVPYWWILVEKVVDEDGCHGHALRARSKGMTATPGANV